MGTTIARKSLLLSATMLVVSSVTALADDKDKSGEIVIAQAGQPAAPATTEKVEKVTVTATRRKTALQKTPVAVTAISEKGVEDARVENIEDLAAIVPSLQITNGGNPTAFTARIRGVGTQGNNAGLEAAVGTFIDGVYRSRASVAFGDLGEIERIEVLRGPQGTLFGRNTSAGILHVITKKPVFDNEYEAEVTAGSFDQYAGKASINVAASDKVAFRLFMTRHEQEGFIDVNPGRPDFYDGNAKSYYAARGQMLWNFTPSVEIRLIADIAEREDQCCSAATIFPGAGGRAATLAFPDTSAPAIINFLEGPLQGKATSNQVENQVAFGDRSTNSDIKDQGFSAEVNWDMGRSSLISITAIRDWETTYAQDADFSGADIVYFADDGTNLTSFNTLTHEMRWTGEFGIVDYLFGFFFSDEDITRRSTLKSGFDQEAFLSLHRRGDSPLTLRTNLGFFGHPIGTPVFAGGLGADDFYQQTSQSIAFFMHHVWHLSDVLDLTTGVRYTSEEKTFDATYRSDGQFGCTSVESLLGLNPAAGAGTQALNVAFTCLPGARHALDVLTTSFGGHHQQREENEFSGILTLAWEIEENVNSYATYSRGHKAGGFNLDRSFADALGSIVIGPAPNTVVAGVLTPNPLFLVPQTVRAPDTSFPAEFVDAFELGLKMAFDDGKFLVNTAVFHQTFDNFQLNTFTGVSFIVTSVPEVISQGVEVETFWRTPVEGLSTGFAVQYTDAHYGNIGSLTEPGTFLALNPGLFLLRGATITHSPEWTVTGGIDYDFPLFGSLLASFHMDARWQSEMNTGSNLDPRKVQEAFAVVGLKAGIYTSDEWLGIEFFARNLFDERYINTAFDSPLHGSSVAPGAPSAFNNSSTIDTFLGEPRMIGATVRIRH